MFKAALAKLATGLLIGIGFALAMTGVTYGFSKWQMDEMKESMFKEYTPEAGLAIKDHRPQKSENNTAFIGALENNGQHTWQSVEILAELYDKNGNFVDKCDSYLDGKISPGQTRNFKVSCSGCRDVSQPLIYDKYTLTIAGASFVSADRLGSN